MKNLININKEFGKTAVDYNPRRILEGADHDVFVDQIHKMPSFSEIVEQLYNERNTGSLEVTPDEQ